MGYWWLLLIPALLPALWCIITVENPALKMQERQERIEQLEREVLPHLYEHEQPSALDKYWGFPNGDIQKIEFDLVYGGSYGPLWRKQSDGSYIVEQP